MTKIKEMKLRVKVIGTEKAERYGRCVSLRQFAELVGEPMPDSVALLEAKSTEGGEA